MKITDLLVSSILKKGILYEAKNCDLEFEIPMTQEEAKEGKQESKIKITFKAEHMTLKIEKE